jgi:hypothetical protein
VMPSRVRSSLALESSSAQSILVGLPMKEAGK